MKGRTLGAVIVAAIMFAIGFLPLFGGPGYEFAVASGLVLPTATAIAVALGVLRAGKATNATPLALLLDGMATGVLFALVALMTAFVHGALRVGFCDFAGGVLYFALAPMPGAIWGGAWGAYVGYGRAVRRGRWPRIACALFAIAAPLLGIGVSLWRFYASPMVFAFDPFFGYFSGTLYDTVIDAGTPLLTYRLGTVCSLTGIALVASLLTRDQESGRFVPARWTPTSTVRLVLAATTLAGSLVMTACGPMLGHWHTPSTIAHELGGTRAGARCDVVHPDGLRDDEVHLLVRDCDEHLAQIEAYLGARGPERVKAYFFHDAGEKKRLMGAADTYIAKPWRGEVYLQIASYPHPVLGHELAHVVAGSFGRGPFRIAGDAGGFVPNPGWIEGVAVAASPDEDELTDAAWAHAMAKLGLLPPLEQIFGLGFLGQQSGKSYTVAGAFVRWMIARHGVETVRALYGGTTTIERVTGKAWPALDGDFRAWLETVPLPPEAEVYARARFDRPSVFGRRCPHVVDALLHEADGCRDGQRFDRALELYDAVLRRDAHDWAAMYGRALAKIRRGRTGDDAAGVEELERLSIGTTVPRTWRDRAAEALADHDWMAGRLDGLAPRYESLAATTVEEDAARTREVKSLGARDPAARHALRAFLIGATPRRGPETLQGAALVGAWADATHDPLADYVLAKNLVNKQLYEAAAPLLTRVLDAGPPTARIHREVLRLDAVIACVLGDASRAARVRVEIASPTNPFRGGGGGRLELLEGLLARCGV